MAINPSLPENNSWSSLTYDWTVKPTSGAAKKIYSYLAVRNPASAEARIVDVQRRHSFTRAAIPRNIIPMPEAPPLQIPTFPTPPIAHVNTYVSVDEQAKAKAKTDKELAKFTQNQSISYTLSLIKKLTDRQIWSIQTRALQEQNFSLINMIMKETGNDLTLWNRLCARIICFFLYDSKIIPYVFETIIKGAMDKIRLEALKNGGGSLKWYIEKQLESIDAFLADYLKQIEAFSNKEGNGNCDHFLTETLKCPDINVYKFAEIVIREFVPKFSFLNKLKENESLFFYIFVCIPLKLLMYIPEEIGNAVLRTVLRNKIQSFVTELIDEINGKTNEKEEKKNVPFYISMTEFILKCLEDFEQKLINEKGNFNFSGTPAISPVVQKPALQIASQLLTISKLPEAMDRKNLKDHFKQSDKHHAKKDSLDKYIQESIVKGTHNLVNYLSNVNNSENCYFTLLESQKIDPTKPPPLEPDPNDEEAIQAAHQQDLNRYTAAKNRMSTIATKVFKLAIGNLLTQTKMDKSINALKENKRIFCENWRKYTTKFFEVLEIQYNQTKEKLNASLILPPNPEQEILLEIHPEKLNEIIDELEKIHTQLKNYINSIEADQSEGNFKTVLKANKDSSEEIIKQIKNLKDNRNKKYATILALNDMKSLNLKFPEEDPTDAEWQNILNERTRISMDNEYNYPEINDLNNFFNSMEENHNKSMDENKILESINKLKVGPNNLIAQLYDKINEKIQMNDDSFWLNRQINSLKNQINNTLLVILPREEHKDERKNVSDRIDAFIRCNTEDDAEEKQTNLINELNGISQIHEMKKLNAIREWNRQWPTLKTRIADNIKNLEAILEDTKQIISQCLQEIDTLICKSKEQVINIQPNKISDKSLIEAAGGYGTIAGTIIGGGIASGASLYFGMNPLTGLLIGAGAGCRFGDEVLMKTTQIYIDRQIVPQVNDVFDKLHGFFIEKHPRKRLIYDAINHFIKKHDASF